MSDVTQDLRLSNSLSDESAKAKRNLLAASFIAIAVSSMQLFPSKISALGIEFDSSNKKGLACLILLACAYSLSAFITYSSTDYLQWRSSILQNRLTYGIAATRSGMGYGTNLAHAFSSKLRLCVDYIFPICLGFYAIYELYEISGRI